MGLEITTTRELRAAGFAVKLRNFVCRAPSRTLKSRDKYVLSRALWPLVPSVRAAYLNESETSAFVRVGKLVLSPPDIPLRIVYPSGRHRAISMMFDRAKFESVAELARNWDIAELESFLDINNPSLDELMLNLAQEIMSPGFASSILVEALGNSILVELSRHFRRRSVRHGEPQRSKVPDVAEQAKAYIDANLSSRLSVAEIASECDLSPSWLARSFKRATGQTIHAYVERARYRKAKELLQCSHLSIKRVASIVGFPSASAFSFAFKQKVGLTPSDFRRTAPIRSNLRQ